MTVDTCIQYNILVYSGKSASTVACKSGKHLVNKSQFTANLYCLNIGDPAKLFTLTIIAQHHAGIGRIFLRH